MTQETVSSSEVRCHMRHVRAVKLCAGGGRAWAERHDLDWNEFLSNGITAQALYDTGCPLVKRIADYAMEEARNG